MYVCVCVSLCVRVYVLHATYWVSEYSLSIKASVGKWEVDIYTGPHIFKGLFEVYDLVLKVGNGLGWG